MKYYIIDASVVARFLLLEDLKEEADRVLQDFLHNICQLSAPDLIDYEIGNTLWKAAKQRYASVGELGKKFEECLQLGIGDISFSIEEKTKIFQWALDHSLTYYDAAYIFAAKKTGYTLLTADQILYEKGSSDVGCLHLRNY